MGWYRIIAMSCSSFVVLYLADRFLGLGYLEGGGLFRTVVGWMFLICCIVVGLFCLVFLLESDMESWSTVMSASSQSPREEESELEKTLKEWMKRMEEVVIYD